MLTSKTYKLLGTYVLIALLSWQFFRYVDYVLNVITPESFSFDFEAIAVVNFVVLVSVISLALAIFTPLEVAAPRSSGLATELRARLLMGFRKKRWALVTSGIVGIIFLLFFEWTYINLVGVLIAMSLFESARFAGVEEIDQWTKINSRTIVRRGATGVVLAFFVLVSFAAYQSPVATGIAETEQLPSVTQQLMRSVVDSVIGSQIPAGPEKEGVISQVTNETFQQINGILKPYLQYAPPLLAFGLFLILWGLSWIFVWLSVVVGMGIFWILKKTEMIKIEERDVKAEILII